MTDLTRDQKSYKTIARKLTDACGGAEHCSGLLDGKSASLIRAYGNPSDTRDTVRFMPLDDIAALERFAGRSIIGEWLVSQVEADPDRERPTVGLGDLSLISKEGGEAKSALALMIQNALNRGGLDRTSCADRQAALKELREAHAAYGRVIEALESFG